MSEIYDRLFALLGKEAGAMTSDMRRDLVRMIVATMREPTATMCQSKKGKFSESNRDAWQGMIDAALTEIDQRRGVSGEHAGHHREE